MAAIEFDKITHSPCASVAELLNLADQLRDMSDDKGQARRFAFRGQPREYKTLDTSFKRQFTQNSHSAAELIEGELIREFREHYGRLPDRSKDMPDPLAIAHTYDLRCLSVMQHYEVPTRLLDWTQDFWTAVYFACASDPGKDAEVWLYDRSIFDAQVAESQDLASLLWKDPNPPPEPILLTRRNEQLLVELDPSHTPRMRQQHAHHTVCTNAFTDHAKSLNSLAMRANKERVDPWFFRRFVISNGCKSNALRYLALHREITASTIFPDVVGLGRFLRWQLDSLKTMML
jgi:hypothetical protein